MPGSAQSSKVRGDKQKDKNEKRKSQESQESQESAGSNNLANLEKIKATSETASLDYGMDEHRRRSADRTQSAGYPDPPAKVSGFNPLKIQRVEGIDAWRNDIDMVPSGPYPKRVNQEDETELQEPQANSSHPWQCYRCTNSEFDEPQFAVGNKCAICEISKSENEEFRKDAQASKKPSSSYGFYS